MKFDIKVYFEKNEFYKDDIFSAVENIKELIGEIKKEYRNEANIDVEIIIGEEG